jgi:spore coat protein H
MLIFSWGEAYDFHVGDISYRFIVAKDLELKDIVYDKTQTNITNIQIESLEPGEYFWRVTATNELGKTQFSFDHIIDSKSILYPGVKRFYINPNGEVQQ